MKRNLLAVTLLLLACAMVGSQWAAANFNAATGFSGRHGFTCTSCHNVPDGGPASGEEVYDPPATVTLDGLPSEWAPRGTYPLTVTVTGGPPAAPAPAPQGGFEIEANGGLFLLPDEGAEFIEIYAEDGRAVTYTVNGTQVRQWNVVWRAPDVPPLDGQQPTEEWDHLNAAPDAITFWVAAMSANGNHVVAAGASDGGELGDSVDNITVTVPASQEAMDAWLAYRLEPPLVDGEHLANRNVTAFEPFTVEVSPKDMESDWLGYSLDGGPWMRLPGRISEWSLAAPVLEVPFPDGLTPGDHELLLRSESDDGRVSDVTTVLIHAADPQADDEVDTPFPFALTTVGLLAFAALRRIT